MGYFSNGTQGMVYEEDWCLKCVHHNGDDGDGCPVWALHMAYNYKECNNPGSFLHTLIPRDGPCNNGRCRMFHRAPAEADLFEAPLNRSEESK